MNAKIIEFVPRDPPKAAPSPENTGETPIDCTQEQRLDCLFELWRIQLLRDDDDLDKPPVRTPF
jgi:hypothetical protein